MGWVGRRAAGGPPPPPRLLRLYAVIAYAQARRIPLAYADMAGALRHQSGKAKGEPLGERQIARLVAELGATGWVTVREREGLQGRHAYEAHDHPLHAVPAAPDTDGGSGADTAGGSLASREDHGTDRPSKSAGGGSGIRRRRLQEVARGPVDNSAPSASATPSRGRGQGEKRSSSGGVAGPGASLSARSWEVLEPVRHLLDGARDWVVRRIDAEIRAQLAAGAGMERLTARLTRRYATTDPVRDGGRWILGAGLPRRGCGLDVCEDGVIWHTGQLCGCVGTASPTSAPAAAEERPAPGRTDEPSPPPEEPTPSVPLPRPRAPEPEPHLELSSDELERLRAAATADDIRRAIEEHGQALATYLYGHRRVVPVLIDLYGPLPQSS
ncbi:hypothetical protein [Streptomyces thermolilacinus]|uniref:hypothetical protein n=1 Tax=Streptomyces thermolilacinus TaxID=285540 RepID=UPI0033E408B3